MCCILFIEFKLFLCNDYTVSSLRVNYPVAAMHNLCLLSKLTRRVFVCLVICVCREMSNQIVCIKFCVKNGIKCSEAFKMLMKAFVDDSMSQSRVYEWYKCFQEGRDDIEDDGRSGCLDTSINDEIVEKVKQIVFANKRITIYHLRGC